MWLIPNWGYIDRIIKKRHENNTHGALSILLLNTFKNARKSKVGSQ